MRYLLIIILTSTLSLSVQAVETLKALPKLAAPVALPQGVQENLSVGVQPQAVVRPANAGQVGPNPVQTNPLPATASILPSNKSPLLAPVVGLPQPANNMIGASQIEQDSSLRPITNGAAALDFATQNKQKCRNMPCILDINGMPPSQVIFISNKPGLSAKQYTVNGWLTTGNSLNNNSPSATLYFADSLETVKLAVKKSSASQWVVEVPTGIKTPLSGKGVLNIFPAPGNQLVASEQSKFESIGLALQDVTNIKNIARYLEPTINDVKAADLKPGSDITIKSSLIKVDPNTQIKVFLIFKESELEYELKNIYVADGFIKTKIPENFSGAIAEKVTIEVQLGSGAAIPKLVNSNSTFTPTIGAVNFKWFSYYFITPECLVNCFDSKGNRSNGPFAFETDDRKGTSTLKLGSRRAFDDNKGQPSSIGNLNDGVSWRAKARFPLNSQFVITRFEALPYEFLSCPTGGDVSEASNRYVYGKFRYNASTSPYIEIGATTTVTHCRQRLVDAVYLGVPDFKYYHQLYSQFTYVIEMKGPLGANPWIVPKNQ